MAGSLGGFQRLPSRRRPRPVAQGVAAVIATVLILACGLLAGRWLLDGTPAPGPSPGPTRSAV